MGWKMPGILRFMPTPTVVPEERIPQTLALLPPGARVLDAGAGGRRVCPGVVTLDAFPVPEVDIVGDIHHLPLPDDSFDCVFCTGTLEHVLDPWQAVREMYRVLKPGGIVHIDVPFIQGFHADPSDYWRFTVNGLKVLCGHFEEIDAGVHIGPTCGLVWIAREWASSCFRNRYLSGLLHLLTAYVTAPFKYLDYLVIRQPQSHRIASAVYFRGRKPALSRNGCPPRGPS